MPTAEPKPAAAPAVDAPPPHQSPSRKPRQEAIMAADLPLVANSSMDDNDNEDVASNDDGSVDLLSSDGGDNKMMLDSHDDDDDDESHEMESESDGQDEEGIAIGRLAEKLDPDAGHCWSCLVNLRAPASAAAASGGAATPSGAATTSASTTASGAAGAAASPSAATASANCGFLYTTHGHPLLNFMVCSVCEERAEAVEDDVIDIEDNSSSTINDKNATPKPEMNACSWCGLEDQELAENDTDDDIPASDLLLCDRCPRAFCVRCVVLSLGGDTSAWEAVKQVINSDDSSEEWICPKCEPTSFLERLRSAYEKISCGSPAPGATTNDDGVIEIDDSSDSNNNNGNDDDDARIQKLLEELDYAEFSLDEATQKLDDSHLERQRSIIESELISSGISLEDLETEVQLGLNAFTNKWQIHYDRFSDTIARLQEELDEMDPGIIGSYYKCRAKERGERRKENEFALQKYKIEADLALERRDAKEGFSKGEFRGASGYKPKDPRVLKLEPEDLNSTCLNEIEDVNTMEGAIEQMQSMAKASAARNEVNPWRSKTGTTELDIEMFKKKAVKFEELTLGERIDLDLLEKRVTTDKDDAVATQREDSMVIRRKGAGTGRVVKRSTSLRAIKKQARKETAKSKLSGNRDQEYQPRLPPPVDTKLPATVPRVKKRANLQRLSGELINANNSSGQISPSMRGLLIGDDTAVYQDSDVVLPVEDCSNSITVCKSLATLLKEHQEEGLKFCWKSVCSKLMNLKQEGNDDIHGAILAHNMGLGKSFQAVCLLHTLLTHPSLVKPASIGGSSGGRIIHRAMLIAPVNTLANWETEFQKWVGTSSGRKIPAIRFYPWNDQRSKIKIVKEWYDYGGILCVSSEKYASAVKAYLDTDKRTSNKKANGKKPAVLTEDDLFLKKALLTPGPDIVVLDEVHSMLKSSTTNIYKALCGLGTRLRLGLTGSPIQNNLYEYFRMASWVKPNCLGTEASFTRKYHDPIMDGMAADCSPLQAETQEKVNSELYDILSNFVHRRDADVLRKELPFLQETIIHVRQSKAQAKLYREFRKYQRMNDDKSFFKQYHALRPVANHPACLMMNEDRKSRSRPSTPTSDQPKEEFVSTSTNENQPRVAPETFAWICDKCQKAKFKTFDEAEEHEETCDGTYDPESGDANAIVDTKGAAKKDKDSDNEEWWKSFALKAEKSGLDLLDIGHGGKIVLLLQIIAHCDLIGDKVVVFSQSLPTLSFIEKILNSPDWGGFKLYLPDNVRKQKAGGWRRNKEYLRIDGSVDAKERGDLIDTFHSDTAAGNQAKLFLISTNAGGLGINLTAANRVILFDSHWNPAVDLQAVYRCYRYGQTKPTYCYRLLAEGSMEQKIYSRAAAKTSLSDLVIDQANPERSFTRHEMDLLRVEDTWVSCNACNKWRMLPPTISAEEVENLPDEWYCKDNIYDPPRSRCEAEERSATWMVSYFERRAREEDEDYIPQGSQGSQGLTRSQGSQGIQGEARTQEARPMFDMRHQEYTERDEVLQSLVDRSEKKKTASTVGTDATSKKVTWVSKWDFNFAKEDKEEPSTADKVEEKEEQPVKSPTKKSPPKNPKAKSPESKPEEKMTSPVAKAREEATKSPAKKRTKSPKKKAANPPREEEEEAAKSSTNEATSASKTPLSPYEEIRKSPRSSRRTRSTSKKTPRNESDGDVGGSSSGKRRRSTRKSARKNSLKVKSEVKSPPKKKKKDEVAKKDEAVVDLTFDSDSN